jgi:hypothetical protein
MAPPIALVVGPIFYENAKWQALAPDVTLKVGILVGNLRQLNL